MIVLPENPVSLYSAANINTQGIGVYDSTEGTEFNFRGIVSGNSSIVVTLDAGTNSIVLTLNVDQIIDDLPQATTVQRGVGETATDAEALAKASITVFLTPSNLAALGSTTIFAGLVELATSAETIAGVDATRAVTPAGLASVVALQQGTQVFADAVARVAADPAFAGQFGVQLDTDIPWISTGAAVGDFNRAILVAGISNAIDTGTEFDLTNNADLSFESTDATGEVNFNNMTVFITAASALSFSGTMNFAGGSQIQVASVAIPANSVLITGGGAGNLSSALRSTFLSSANTNAGWTNFTNSLVRKTGDCNALTLPQLCQIVDTLIQTLGASHLLPIP